ncbi:MAG: hypothetical protein KBG80_11120 [Breznakibacter sp.]|nr:hypothetical protein [Breznakibacter sp.]
MNQPFQIPASLKRILIAVAIIGALLVAASVVLGLNSGKEFWANILLNGYLYLGIAGSVTLFLAIHTIAESGWHVAIQRVLESIGAYLPIAGVILLLLVPGIHSIYEWSHPTEDKLLLAKQPFLNMPFFLIRTFGFIAIWSGLMIWIRKYSLLMDLDPNPDYFKKIKRLSSIFVPLFVFTYFFSSWDWIMSLEPHWYSTMYGFYMVANAMASGLSATILILYLIKRFGGLREVNEEHLHDLGKYLFGVSIFWGYLWGSQYLLIWFSNIPEESVYFVKRWDNYPILMNINVILNFFVPLFLLMTRGSKRIWSWVALVSAIVLVGHWLDYFINIMPGATESFPSISIISIGAALLFAATFVYIVLLNFSKHAEMPQNHPYKEESFEYEND